MSAVTGTTATSRSTGPEANWSPQIICTCQTGHPINLTLLFGRKGWPAFSFRAGGCLRPAAGGGPRSPPPTLVCHLQRGVAGGGHGAYWRAPHGDNWVQRRRGGPAGPAAPASVGHGVRGDHSPAQGGPRAHLRLQAQCPLAPPVCKRCNALAYVAVDEESPGQFPHRDVLRDLLPPDAQLYSVFASITGDTPGPAAGWWVPQSKRCLPNREPPPVTIVPRWGGGGRGFLRGVLSFGTGTSSAHTERGMGRGGSYAVLCPCARGGRSRCCAGAETSSS